MGDESPLLNLASNWVSTLPSGSAGPLRISPPAPISTASSYATRRKHLAGAKRLLPDGTQSHALSAAVGTSGGKRTRPPAPKSLPLGTCLRGKTAAGKSLQTGTAQRSSGVANASGIK